MKNTSLDGQALKPLDVGLSGWTRSYACDRAGNWDEIVPLSQQYRGFAFSSPRNNKGCTCVLAVRNDMTVAEVVKRLAAIRTGTSDGLVLSVDQYQDAGVLAER